jgi:hypothetical protein
MRHFVANRAPAVITVGASLAVWYSTADRQCFCILEQGARPSGSAETTRSMIFVEKTKECWRIPILTTPLTHGIRTCAWRPYLTTRPKSTRLVPPISCLDYRVPLYHPTSLTPCLNHVAFVFESIATPVFSLTNTCQFPSYEYGNAQSP